MINLALVVQITVHRISTEAILGSKSSHFQNNAKFKMFHFQITGFALSLALKQGLGVPQNE